MAPIEITGASGYGATPVTSISSEIERTLAKAFHDSSTVVVVDAPLSPAPRAGSAEHASPRQAILRVALGPAKIERKSSRESSPETERALKEASDIETRGIDLVAQADRRQGSAESAAGSAAQAAANSTFKADLIACSLISLNAFNCKGEWSCIAAINSKAQDCQDRAGQRQRERANIAAEGVRARVGQDASNSRAEGQRLLDQAAALRRDTLQKSTESYELHVESIVDAKWTLSDAHGTVLASGDEHGESLRNDSGLPKEVAVAESGPSIDGVVRQASQNCALSIATRVSEVMKSIPFRAKVVRATTESVVINAGADVGVSVGDTFGLLSRQSPLTDPDTGVSLETAPQPTGKLRVTQVQPLYSTAVRIETGGQPKRGDEVQWVGIWGPKDMKPTTARRSVSDSHLVTLDRVPGPTPTPTPTQTNAPVEIAPGHFPDVGWAREAPLETPQPDAVAPIPPASICPDLRRLGESFAAYVSADAQAAEIFVAAQRSQQGSPDVNSHHYSALAELKALTGDIRTGRYEAVSRSHGGSVLANLLELLDRYERMMLTMSEAHSSPSVGSMQKAIEALKQFMASGEACMKALAALSKETSASCPNWLP